MEIDLSLLHSNTVEEINIDNTYNLDSSYYKDSDIKSLSDIECIPLQSNMMTISLKIV